MFIKLYPTAQGAITQLYAGTAPEGKDLNGKVTALYSLHGQINAMNRLINCYLDFFTLVSDPVGTTRDSTRGDAGWSFGEETLGVDGEANGRCLSTGTDVSRVFTCWRRHILTSVPTGRTCT